MKSTTKIKTNNRGRGYITQKTFKAYRNASWRRTFGVAALVFILTTNFASQWGYKVKAPKIVTEVQAVEVPYELIKEIEKPKMTKEDMQEYIRTEVNNAGLDGDRAIRMIGSCENPSWDPFDSFINIHSIKSATLDRGLWMINDYWHAEVSDECAFDVECSTKEAIRILKQSGWSQWSCVTVRGF